MVSVNPREINKVESIFRKYSRSSTPLPSPLLQSVYPSHSFVFRNSLENIFLMGPIFHSEESNANNPHSNASIISSEPELLNS